MKKLLTRVGVLTVVFVVAVLVFSRMTNQGNDNMSVDMGAPQLPRISFVTNEYEINSLAGYEEDMEIPSIRDTVTPINGGMVNLQLQNSRKDIKKLTWQVFTLDGKECLQQETVEDISEEMSLKIQGSNVLSEERVLKITLHFEERDVYYYTRIKSDNECNYVTCMDYVTEFHENTFTKSNIETIQNALETNSARGGYGFQDVNIYSSVERVTWGDLAPEIVGDVGYEVKECNETYTSIMLNYRVTCPGVEDDAGAVYTVKEFYRVRFWNDKVFLLDYERGMNQVFDGTKKALDGNGILLGIAPSDIEYLSNADGTIVSFVQNRELWNYNKEADELSLVFSFADAEGVDERNLYDQHEIHIIDVEDNGNTAFSVVGYMNRGKYEGQVGVAVYYYDSEKNSVEEKAFVPTRKGYQVMKEELGKYVYYSNSTKVLYVMVSGTLYAIDLVEDTRDVLVRGLDEGQYRVSDDGSRIAYQSTGGKLYECQKIKVLDLKTGTSSEINAAGEEFLQPLGFVKQDLVYGYHKKENVTTTLAGDTIYPMHKLEIVNADGKVVKTYEIDNVFVSGYYIEDNMLTIERMERKDEGYVSIANDYITNNEEVEESNIYLEAFTRGKKGAQMQIVYRTGISDDEAKVLNPKQVLKEKSTVLEFDQDTMSERYYVYAFGELKGVYEKEHQAISQAQKLEGVAVTYRQAYLWEKGNWPNVYEVNDMQSFRADINQSTLAACLERMLQVEGVTADVQKELEAGLTPKEVLTKYCGGEGLNLTGCTVEEILYTISRETPVTVLVGDGNSILLIGYNKSNIAYLDPATGERKSVSKETMDRMMAAAGNVVIAYAK